MNRGGVAAARLLEFLELLLAQHLALMAERDVAARVGDAAVGVPDEQVRLREPREGIGVLGRLREDALVQGHGLQEQLVALGRLGLHAAEDDGVPRLVEELFEGVGVAVVVVREVDVDLRQVALELELDVPPRGVVPVEV